MCAHVMEKSLHPGFVATNPDVEISPSRVRTLYIVGP